MRWVYRVGERGCEVDGVVEACCCVEEKGLMGRFRGDGWMVGVVRAV